MRWAAVAQSLLAEVEAHRQELQQWSTKFRMVHQLVKFCGEANEKLVIFSENLTTLDSLQRMLQVSPTFLAASEGDLKPC